MQQLILRELKLQIKIYNKILYSLMFLCYCMLSVVLANNIDNISSFSVIFTICSIPIMFIGFSGNIIKNDIEDGSLEILLTCHSAFYIIMSKLIALTLCTIISLVVFMPIIWFLFNLDLYVVCILLICSALLLKLSACLCVLIASAQGYFRSNTNFLSILIMPILIPAIIICGMALQNSGSSYLIAILVGINMIIAPIAIYLSTYLVENIYSNLS